MNINLTWRYVFLCWVHHILTFLWKFLRQLLNWRSLHCINKRNGCWVSMWFVYSTNICISIHYWHMCISYAQSPPLSLSCCAHYFNSLLEFWWKRNKNWSAVSNISLFFVLPFIFAVFFSSNFITFFNVYFIVLIKASFSQ